MTLLRLTKFDLFHGLREPPRAAEEPIEIIYSSLTPGLRDANSLRWRVAGASPRGAFYGTYPTSARHIDSPIWVEPRALIATHRTAVIGATPSLRGAPAKVP